MIFLNFFVCLPFWQLFIRTRREFGAWCRLEVIPFSSILPWRLQYGTHLEQNCFRFHPNPWPRQDDPLSRIYSIYSLLWDTRVPAATAPTLGRTLDIGVMTTDIPAQQPGTAALLTGEMFTTNKQFNTAERCSKYSFQIVAVDVLPDDDEFTKWAFDPAQPRPPCAAADDQ